MKAIWKDTVVAESDETVVVEGNHYFPPETIREEYFKPSPTKTVCPWKGKASYYDLVVKNEINSDAAWYYPEVSELAKGIKGYIAFWKGVQIEK